MTSRQAKIQEDTHFRIMRILQDNPDLTQRELADKLGMSVGGLRKCSNLGFVNSIWLIGVGHRRSPAIPAIDRYRAISGELTLR